MKVLDPQSALLTTAEVHQFLKETPIREKDKKIGAYDVVNVVNNHLVRRDVEHYISLVHPQIQTYPEPAKYTRPIFLRLKKYNLTKAEIYSLINLGVGLSPSSQPSSSINNTTTVSGTDADADEPTVVVKTEQTNGTTSHDDEEADAEAEEQQESDLSKSLFRLIVEESDDRFPGDEGEQQIDDILAILQECIQGNGESGEHQRNGHNGDDMDAADEGDEDEEEETTGVVKMEDQP